MMVCYHIFLSNMADDKDHNKDHNKDYDTTSQFNDSVHSTSPKDQLKVFCLSDVHTELAARTVEIPDCDLLILAGDIGNVKSSLSKTNLKNFLASTSHIPHVVYVPGNHEYYGSAINRADDKIRELLPSHVIFLNCDSYQFQHHGKIYIVHGCTLWSNITGIALAAEWMNDYHKIKISSITNGKVGGYIRMSPNYTIALHKKHLTWLTDALATHSEITQIVVTHHVPYIPQEIDYQKEPVASCYYTDLTAVIRKYQPALWCYGHTHKSCTTTIGKTIVHSNQLGYPGYDSDVNMNIQVTLL